MTIGVVLEALDYSLSCGIVTPDPGGSMFQLDPEVKEETVHYRDNGHRVALLERGVTSVSARDAEGRRVTYPMSLSPSESVLAQLREPHRFPHLSALRQEFLDWRFYHHFRTDPDSPLRAAQVGTRTPILSHDGEDLAAALQTVREIGDGPALDEAIDRAFPGAELRIEPELGRLRLALHMSGFFRAFEARELSDGTLRYLCLLAALHSPRPPALLALNEPETSIHPDLLEPLAAMIARASQASQLWVTTHSEALAAYIQAECPARLIRLEKLNGETCARD
jgi:predicted ATPase